MIDEKELIAKLEHMAKESKEESGLKEPALLQNIIEEVKDMAVNEEIKARIEREDVKVDVQVKEKLAPQMPIRTNIAIGANLDTGEIYADEYGSGHIRGQISMDETKEDNIVDFRKQEAK
jgi:hypothetical protein